jgi:two-component system LytT family response regulator
VIVISAYQYYRRSKTTVAQSRADRLIVQTGAGDSVLRFEQIDYLEAARNYISVHADGREYVIRDTMTNVMRRLSGGPFARTHRSVIVNIDKIREIRSIDSGQRVFLTGGEDVPLSLSYREEFTRKIAG